mgnify:FL=1|tara:strand:- start:334 stop:609 length:276 start_codon:yes stop_codon:yes gene_type:complete
MKKTILFITLLSFSTLSLHTHHEEVDHLHHSTVVTAEEVCDTCTFNSDKIFTEIKHNYVIVSVQDISFLCYIARFITSNTYTYNNKSPPKA